MRTQVEILEQIQLLAKSGSDPYEVQHKVLVHKLTWTVAKAYIKLDQINDENKRNWKKTSRLDTQSLLQSIYDELDAAFFKFYDNDVQGVFISIQIIITLLWLLGEKQTSLLSHVMYMMEQALEPMDVFKFICIEFDFPWSHFDRRYNPKYNDQKIILPEGTEL